METKPELYFKNTNEWRTWLQNNHKTSPGIYLILYKVSHEKESMLWEDAVKVALCFGWIDSTVKNLGDGKRRQYFCKRKEKSVWSKLNKLHINNLTADGLMHQSGLDSVETGKQNGSWTALDAVEKGIIPENLMTAFKQNPNAFNNYNNFAPSYKKQYLHWLSQAKREETKQKRIAEIVKLCDSNIKSKYV
ncbi:MAG: YdeI/OmpD-associated family protein [Cellulophaga sp.]